MPVPVTKQREVHQTSQLVWVSRTEGRREVWWCAPAPEFVFKFLSALQSDMHTLIAAYSMHRLTPYKWNCAGMS